MAIDWGQILSGILGGGGISNEVINGILAALTAAAGSQGTPFSESGKSTSSGNIATGTTSTSNPNLNPAVTGIINQLAAQYPNMMQGPPLQGLEARNIQQINQNSDAQKEAIENEMAARGLSSSPAAATAAANVEQNRINQITQMQEQLPIQQFQNKLAAMQQAGTFGTSVPYGTGINTQGNQASSQSGTNDLSGSQGGGLGGLLSGLAGTLALVNAMKGSNNGNANRGPNGTGGNGGSPTDTQSQNDPVTVTIYNSSGQPQTVTSGGGKSNVNNLPVTGTPPILPNVPSYDQRGPYNGTNSTFKPGDPSQNGYPGYGNNGPYGNNPGPPTTTTIDPGNNYPPGTPIDPNVPVQNPYGGYPGTSDPGQSDPGQSDPTGGTGIDPNGGGYYDPVSGGGSGTGGGGGFGGDMVDPNSSLAELGNAMYGNNIAMAPLARTASNNLMAVNARTTPVNWGPPASGPSQQPPLIHLGNRGQQRTPTGQGSSNVTRQQQPSLPISSVYNQNQQAQIAQQAGNNPAAAALSNFNGDYGKLASTLAGIYDPTSLLGQQMAKLAANPNSITPYMQQQMLNNLGSTVGGKLQIAGPNQPLPITSNPGGVMAGPRQSLFYPGGGNPVVMPNSSLPLYNMPSFNANGARV